MSVKYLVLILALAAGAVTLVYATQRPAAQEPMAAPDGVEVIVIVGKREHGADSHR